MALQIVVAVPLQGKPTVVKVRETVSPSFKPFTVRLEGATIFPVTTVVLPLTE